MSGHAPFSLVDFRKGELSRTVYRWVLEGKVFSFRLKAPSDRCFLFSPWAFHLILHIFLSLCDLFVDFVLVPVLLSLHFFNLIISFFYSLSALCVRKLDCSMFHHPFISSFCCLCPVLRHMVSEAALWTRGGFLCTSDGQ